MPGQFCHSAQIDPGHNKSTGKGMAVAMLCVVSDRRLFESDHKPPSRVLQGVSGRTDTQPTSGQCDGPGAGCIEPGQKA
jgi:hypothetical protein